jgi:hypothetical protein
VRLFGEQVDDLAFAFIAPLGAYDCDGRHSSIPRSEVRAVAGCCRSGPDGTSRRR